MLRLSVPFAAFLADIWSNAKTFDAIGAEGAVGADGATGADGADGAGGATGADGAGGATGAVGADGAAGGAGVCALMTAPIAANTTNPTLLAHRVIRLMPLS
jgi:hypothetical protein